MMNIRSSALPAVALILATALVGCGDDSGDDAAAGTAASSAPAEEAPTEEPSQEASTPASEEATEPAESPAPKNLIDITIKGGKITPAPGTVSMPLGERVTIQITSDVAEELHLHGYDETMELVPGKTGQVAFKADIPGVFEAELEESGELLFELKVQ